MQDIEQFIVCYILCKKVEDKVKKRIKGVETEANICECTLSHSFDFETVENAMFSESLVGQFPSHQAPQGKLAPLTPHGSGAQFRV